MTLLVLAVVCLVMMQQPVQAQTFAEWFRQKSTQRKYLLQQITALWMYKGYAMKGYDIAKGGLGSIGGYLGKEFDLHGDYYQRLQKVNTLVSNDPQVAAILRWQQDILKHTDGLQKMPGLTQEERSHVKKVCAALLVDCEGQLNDLEIILEDGKVGMSDEQRFRQIGRLYANMQDNYRFAANFNGQVRLYVLHRKQSSKEVNTLKAIYGSEH